MEKTDNITESGKDLKEAEGVDFKGIVDGKAVIELQSGTYQFDMEKGSPDRVEESTSPNLRIHPNPFCDRLHLSCSEDIRYASVTACNGQILYRQWWEHRHVCLGTRHLRGEGGHAGTQLHRKGYQEIK